MFYLGLLLARSHAVIPSPPQSTGGGGGGGGGGASALASCFCWPVYTVHVLRKGGGGRVK
jgi:hypothetical protein